MSIGDMSGSSSCEPHRIRHTGHAHRDQHVSHASDWPVVCVYRALQTTRYILLHFIATSENLYLYEEYNGSKFTSLFRFFFVSYLCILI